jgi:hypothetical protein
MTRWIFVILILLSYSCINYKNDKKSISNIPDTKSQDTIIYNGKDLNKKYKESGQPIFSVGISIPQNSGLAFVNYMTYRVANDTFYIINSGNASDTARKEVIIEKHPVPKDLLIKLKEAVTKIDSVGLQFNLCYDIIYGWPRFSIQFNDYGRTVEGFVANVYRKNIFDVVDILNNINPTGNIITYDKKELIQQEEDCKGKLSKE